MGKLIAGMASSHAFTFLEPKTWDQKGEIELRQWIALMVMVGTCKPGLLTLGWQLGIGISHRLKPSVF